MAAGTDGEEAFEEGTEKHPNLQCKQCKQCTREQEPKVEGKEEGVPAGVCRNTSTAARVKKERIVLERDSGPRPEARKEKKGRRKVAKVTPEFSGPVGTQDTLRQIAHRELEQESEHCRRRQRRHQRGSARRRR